VRTHVETCKKALYVNRTFTIRFKEMTEVESAPLKFLTAGAPNEEWARSANCHAPSCVAQPFALIVRTSDFGPHVVPRCLLDTTSVSQPAELTQFILGPPLKLTFQSSATVPRF
jgi:hypothetical protein